MPEGRCICPKLVDMNNLAYWSEACYLRLLQGEYQDANQLAVRPDTFGRGCPPARNPPSLLLRRRSRLRCHPRRSRRIQPRSRHRAPQTPAATPPADAPATAPASEPPGTAAPAATPSAGATPAAAQAPAQVAHAQPAQPATPPPPPPPQWKEVTLPAGTQLGLTLHTAVASDTSKVEDPVQATLRRDIVSDELDRAAGRHAPHRIGGRRRALGQGEGTRPPVASASRRSSWTTNGTT